MATKVVSPLKALTESQLKAVEVMVKHDLTLDVQERTNWKGGWDVSGAILQKPAANGEKIREAFSLALTGRQWGASSAKMAQLAGSLMKKGVLTKIAVVKPEEGNKWDKKMHRTNRYAISNEVREAAGAVGVALDDLRAKEEAKIAREDAWDEAREPLDKQARDITSSEFGIRQKLRDLIKDPTPDALVDAHRQYHELVVELEKLNVQLKAVAAQHNRKYEPFLMRGW